jgi:hypothetical protein
MSSKFSLSVVGSLVLALLITGCGSGSSTGGGGGGGTTQPTATLTATSLTFAGAPNVATAAQTVTLTNTGSSALSIPSITLAVATAGTFSETSTCGTVLGAGASCTISATFTSGSATSYSGTITLTDNSGGGGNVTQTIALSGTNSTPTASLTATSLTFLGANGVATAAQTVTLSNAGGAVLNISGIVLGGANASNFALNPASTCGATLAAGGSCVISVTFTAGSASSYAASVTVTDNSSSGTTQTITLSGTATAPVAKLSANTIAFANTLTGVTSAVQTVTLTNTGNAVMTMSSIMLGGTNPADFGETNNCGATLAVNAYCTISVTFTPATATGYSASVAITDNAAGSPQSIGLTGAGTTSAAVLSSSTISFANTSVGVTTAAQTVTLTNTGSATLNIASIVLGGTNPTDFNETNNCGATLTAGAYCTISATFTPAAALSYSATVTITDDAKPATQVLTLSGAGSSSAITYQLYTIPETDNSVTPLYALVNNAKSTIDMTMYALEDTTFTADLVAACKKGVVVRVILDQNDEKSGNTSAYNTLNAQANCSAVWANKAFEATHEKCFVIDGTTIAVMSLNLQSQYYSTTRDFAMVYNDPVDIAAVEATFNMDYAAGTPSSGVAGTSDFGYAPGPGTDLIWSPTTAQADMTSIIANAKSTLLIENEEMASSATTIIPALETACSKGVVVHIAMVDQSSYESNFKALEAQGCLVHVYPDTTNGFYIHAKAVVADYGLSTQSVYMGSINYSGASMNNNRELGMYITDTASVVSLYTIMAQDFAGGTEY